MYVVKSDALELQNIAQTTESWTIFDDLKDQRCDSSNCPCSRMVRLDSSLAIEDQMTFSPGPLKYAAQENKFVLLNGDE